MKSNFLKVVWRTLLFKLKGHSEKKDSVISKYLGVSQLKTTNTILLYVHAFVAFALFVGTGYGLAYYMHAGKKLIHGAAFITFLPPIIYLAVVHYLNKRKAS